MFGKNVRFNRLLHKGKMLCVPLDHGLTISNISHLTNFKKTVSSIIENNASSIIVHKGMIRFLPLLENTGLIIHLSASTEYFRTVHKVIVCEVDEAIQLGADCVSIHVNLGNDYEKNMLIDFARIGRDCQKYGIPLFAMMYIRDNNNQDISTIDSEIHSIRIATELGADIVKIGSNWSSDKLKLIIKDALIPVVIAGGDVLDLQQFYELTSESMKSGILGVSFGRNVFMSEKPNETIKNLAKIIYNS